jgi:hypothetical protein
MQHTVGRMNFDFALAVQFRAKRVSAGVKYLGWLPSDSAIRDFALIASMGNCQTFVT